jgi:hypothetical protein
MDSSATASYPIPTSLLAIAVAALLISLSITKRFLFHSRRKRNYPPIAGTFVEILLNLHRYAEYLTTLSRKYKTFRILIPFGHYMYTVDPANVEYILKTNFANYGKVSIDLKILKIAIGCVICETELDGISG